MTKKEITKLAVEAQNILAALEDYKKLYARLDEITLLLKDQKVDGSGIAIVDNFSNKNVVFKASGIRRFEIKKVA